MGGTEGKPTETYHESDQRQVISKTIYRQAQIRRPEKATRKQWNTSTTLGKGKNRYTQRDEKRQKRAAKEKAYMRIASIQNILGPLANGFNYDTQHQTTPNAIL